MPSQGSTDIMDVYTQQDEPHKKSVCLFQCWGGFSVYFILNTSLWYVCYTVTTASFCLLSKLFKKQQKVTADMFR